MVKYPRKNIWPVGSSPLLFNCHRTVHKQAQSKKKSPAEKNAVRAAPAVCNRGTRALVWVKPGGHQSQRYWYGTFTPYNSLTVSFLTAYHNDTPTLAACISVCIACIFVPLGHSSSRRSHLARLLGNFPIQIHRPQSRLSRLSLPSFSARPATCTH